MRIALLTEMPTPNAVYRSIGPLRTLEERGHQLRKLDPEDPQTWHEPVRWCDLLHIHRACDGNVVELARAAKAAGAAVVWDDDDDVTRPPPGSMPHSQMKGLNRTKRLTARSKLFDVVDLVTTPSAFLADLFRSAGARQVRVIENYIVDEFVCNPAPHSGMRIGWVAGSEHHIDAERLQMADVLARLLAAHPSAHVVTVGIKLPISHDRYTHVQAVPPIQLLEHVASFDIGIAPLASEVAINHSRSNVKLKEYSAVGVPWLASPIGPYAALDERHGGRLVDDGHWHRELDALIGAPRLRRRLAKRARRWGRSETLRHNVSCWETAFEQVLTEGRIAA